jgi:hypothetical protein
MSLGTAVTFGIASYLIVSLLIHSAELRSFYGLLRDGFNRVAPTASNRQR